MVRKPIHATDVARVSALCDKAADHIAEAHRALHDPEETERAIAKLDAALDCLRGCDPRG